MCTCHIIYFRSFLLFSVSTIFPMPIVVYLLCCNELFILSGYKVAAVVPSFTSVRISPDCQLD